jgi:hypothetical protein
MSRDKRLRERLKDRSPALEHNQRVNSGRVDALTGVDKEKEAQALVLGEDIENETDEAKKKKLVQRLHLLQSK